MAEYRKRKRGSVIFSPYYKLQIWSETNWTWSDVQKRFTSIQEAKDEAPKDKKIRIIEITMGGRRICD